VNTRGILRTGANGFTDLRTGIGQELRVSPRRAIVILIIRLTGLLESVTGTDIALPANPTVPVALITCGFGSCLHSRLCPTR
jgi:hypothetical protein